MQAVEAEIRAQKQAALDALRRGDALSARQQFETITAAGHGDALIWLALAAACMALGDKASVIAAVDNVLALEPRNLRALIMKADHFAETGDAPTASSFYRAAINAAPAAGRLPPDLLGELRRAEATCKRFAQDYEDYLRRRLAERGYDDRSSSERFTQSLDLLHGKKQIYHQEPRHYYFPELPQIQFYNRNVFPWLRAVETATDAIRSEAAAILNEDHLFSPYVTRDLKERPRNAQLGMLDNRDWSAFFLWKNGDVMPENAARCPATMRALEHVPFSRAAGRMPSVLFSLLRPGTRIPPHSGLLNSRLICHLPLIVPEKCKFRVGNDVREWVEGETFIFDDTMEHEAWNDSDKPRVVLIFEIWRPELTQDEQSLVSAMLEAIDAYGVGVKEWDT